MQLAGYIAHVFRQDPAAMLEGGMFKVAVRLAAADFVVEQLTGSNPRPAPGAPSE